MVGKWLFNSNPLYLLIVISLFASKVNSLLSVHFTPYIVENARTMMDYFLSVYILDFLSGQVSKQSAYLQEEALLISV